MFFGALAINSWGFMSYIYLSLVSVLDDIMAIDASGDLKISSFLMDLGVRVAEGLFTGATGAAGAMVGIVKVLVMLVIAVMLVVNFFNQGILRPIHSFGILGSTCSNRIWYGNP